MDAEKLEQAATYIVKQYYRDSVQVQEIIALVRAAERATIERCAQVCEKEAADTRKRFEGHAPPVDVIALEAAAAAIRALSDEAERAGRET